MRRCEGVCVEDSTEHCGDTCARCVAPSGGTSTCAAGACDFICGANLKKCSVTCISGCCDDGDCPGGFACSGNVCKTTCSSSSDCALGYFFSASRCHLAAVQIEAGGLHTCALLADGTVRCWGSHTAGQLGDGSSAPSSTVPVTVTDLGGVVAITAGDLHTCALRQGGSV